MGAYNTPDTDGRDRSVKVGHETSGYATWFTAGGAIREPPNP